jgi:hypothetical protein
MGFFSKIKENLNHGGVKVRLDAPASIAMQDGQVPVTITVVAGSSPARINGVKIEIVAESRSPSAQAAGAAPMRVVAETSNAEQFALNPGESKAVQLQFGMNLGAALADQLPKDSGMAQIAEALGGLQAAADALSPSAESYYIKASADVDGVMLDPSAQRPIQVLKPGQLGGAL